MQNNIKSLFIISVLGTSVHVASAQNEMDAYKFSNTQLMGTARSLGVGGAMGAVGGDMSAVSINPAGIGVYRKSEMAFTPTLKFNNVKTSYLGTDNTTNSARFSINNFGFVFANPSSNKAWRTLNFGVNYNKVGDFNTKGFYSGINNKSSITQMFAADAKANGTEDNLIPPFGYLGYNAFLMDDSYNSYVSSNILNQGGSVYQDKYWKNNGNIQEWSFSAGGNYRDKLFLGGSLNLVSYKFNSTVEYYEDDNTKNPNNNFDFLFYEEYLSSRGTGVNLKLGALYNITPDFRIGANIQTPTWVSFTDESDYKIITETEGARAANGYSGTRSEVQPQNINVYDYYMRSPWKLGVNAMAFLGNKGFVSFDYDFVDYASMNYNFADVDYKFENAMNQAIDNTFKASHSFRLGVEGRYKNLYGRAGAGYTTSPFQNNATYGGDRTHFALGAGLNLKDFNVNLSYTQVFQNFSEYSYPMTAKNVTMSLADVNNNYGLLSLSVILKF